MDIYTPPPVPPPPGFAGRPVIVRVHGGSFQCGNKKGKAAKTLSFARAGYVVVTINYRLTPQQRGQPATACRRSYQLAINTLDIMLIHGLQGDVDEKPDRWGQANRRAPGRATQTSG